MFEEDAIAEMEELGHQFFVFVNAETERVAILYAPATTATSGSSNRSSAATTRAAARTGAGGATSALLAVVRSAVLAG